MPKLSFHGAAETVTGSKYLLEADGARVLIDCGLFQGLKELRQRNWQPLPFASADVQAAVITHAHIDHIGYLPRLVRDGFAGPIYSTPATESISELQLLDSAHMQEEDAEYANRKGFSKHKPALPLYTAEDVKRTMKRFRTVQRGEWFSPQPPIWFRYHDTGHLLGSSMIECEIRSGAKPMRVLFSGDVGRYDAPLYFDPAAPPACDYLVCESTYGDRNHPPGNVLDELQAAVLDTLARSGVLLMAAFAVGRAQQFIYLLQVLIDQNRIPPIVIYLDSPMAVAGMNIFRHYSQEHDLSEALRANKDYEFDLRHVRLVKTANESKTINGVKTGAVIISSSGMMVGGRILHHLKQRLPSPKNTVMLGGFMAEGTRGRAMQDGQSTVRIHGQDIPVRAKIVSMSALSGHAGHDELLRWLGPLAQPKQAFITHGEKPSAVALADELRRTRGWNAVVPTMGQSFDLL